MGQLLSARFSPRRSKRSLSAVSSSLDGLLFPPRTDLSKTIGLRCCYHCIELAYFKENLFWQAIISKVGIVW